MMRRRHVTNRRISPEAGFSLAELTIALLITTIISGAIYAMMASGQGAMRREPELSDRQQNARMAMDLLSKDALNAGNAVPGFMQIFQPSFPDGQSVNDQGVQGPNGKTDRMWLYGNDGNCPSLEVCHGGQGASLTTRTLFPSCYSMPGPLLVWTTTAQNGCPTPTCSAILWGCEPGNGANHSCNGGNGNGANGHTNFPPGQSNLNPPGGPPFIPDGVSAVGSMMYEIRYDTEGVPNLWRTNLGGIDVPTSGQCSNPDLANSGGWGIVARGIEDLQVQYMSQGDFASQTWTNVPPNVVAGNYDTIIRQVKISISARTNLAKLAGETTATNTSMPSGRTAVRGRLQTIVTPRQALTVLRGASPTPLYF